FPEYYFDDNYLKIELIKEIRKKEI
ncbi:hypothetical protein LCGC14_1870430, partial [marine sediment metagenome]